MTEWRSSVYIVDIHIGRFDRVFWNGLQEVNSVLQNHHSSKTNEGKEKEQEGRERKGKNTTHSFSLSPLPLYSREHFTSLHFTSAQLSSAQLSSKTQPTTNPSIHNVHNRRLLHSPTPHPIPPPLHPLNPLLHHTNHRHHQHHPKTKTTKTKPHLGRNFPLNSMDSSPFADNSPMHEFD